MRKRRALAAAAAALAGVLLAAGPAEAHGLVGRTDLPIPEWLFGWAAAVVLIVSFVALAVLWPEPRFERDRWRPLPAGVSRVLASRALGALCGAIGAALLVVVVWAGFAGTQSATANFAPTFVYVIFWLGLAGASVLFGDVYRAFNPWRAIARGVAGAAAAISRSPLPKPLPYPERVGHWPAAIGILAFAWLELAASGGDVPQNIAIATLIYSAVTFVGMALYGIEAWLDRGEAFSVYFGLFARMAPLERRGREVGVRPPLSALARLDPVPGTVALLAVMIGSVTFDGGAEGSLWSDIAPGIADFFESIGLSPERALEWTFGLGLVVACVLVYAFYMLGIAGARSVGGGFDGRRLAGAFVHSLVPIAFVYAAAHYFTLLLFQGQAFFFLASDPLGKGWDLFGTADRSIDYSIISATATWYVQVALVVLGHVAALILAHDRAIALYRNARQAVRSQYWMLAVMVGFTTLALWLLSQSNQ